MLHHAAFERRDPKMLVGLYGGLQAAVFAIIQQIVQTIISDGVKIAMPEYYTAKDGEIVVAEYVDESGHRRILMREIQAHPLFKPLGELLSRNGLSLADMGMTAKVVEDEQQEFGRLQSQENTREALSDYARTQAKAIENLSNLMKRATDKRDRDPILIEYQQQNGGQ